MEYIPVAILIIVIVLLMLAAWPKKYRLQSPIKKVTPKKRQARRKATRKREIRIRLP